METSAAEQRLWAEGLQRVPAPDGFSERVMARIANGEAAIVLGTGTSDGAFPDEAPRRGMLLEFRRPAWRAAYAAAALLAVTAGTLAIEHHRAEQRRVDAAAAQFDQAMQVTGDALDHVSVQLQETENGALQRAMEEKGGR